MTIARNHERKGVSEEVVKEFIELLRKPYEPIKPVLPKPVNPRSINSSPYDSSGRPKV